MTNFRFIILVVAILLISSCNKESSLTTEDYQDHLTVGKWNLNMKLNQDGSSAETYNEEWTFKSDGTFELYSEVATPLYSYSSWACDDDTIDLVHIQYWGGMKNFKILNITDTECELVASPLVNGSYETFKLSR